MTTHHWQGQLGEQVNKIESIPGRVSDGPATEKINRQKLQANEITD